MPSPIASSSIAGKRRARPRSHSKQSSLPRQRSTEAFAPSHLDRQRDEQQNGDDDQQAAQHEQDEAGDTLPFPELALDSSSGGDSGSDSMERPEGEESSSDEDDAQRSGGSDGVAAPSMRLLLAPPSPTAPSLAYESDSSGDEGETGHELRYKNRVGAVPLEWYRDEAHIGYDAAGRRIQRKQRADAIDAFLARVGADSRHTLYDAVNDEHVTLTADELASLQRIRHGGYAHIAFDPYADYDSEAFTRQVRHEAIGNPQEPKRRFIPSAWEAKRVVKLVRAMRNGWLRSIDEAQAHRAKQREQQQAAFLMWGSDGQLLTGAGEERTGLHRMPPAIPPPKLALPGHAHSYNPPAEYLMSRAEEEQWRQQDPADRPLDFVPRRYLAMRLIPAYTEYVKERFERCLDLYLCPRVRRRKLHIDPQSLIPALPKPAELRPFPTTVAVRYVGHTGRVRSIAVDSSGEWLASGAEDGTVRLWEVSSGRCFKRWDIRAAEAEGKAQTMAPVEEKPHASGSSTSSGGTSATRRPLPVVEHVAFCPDERRPLLSVCVGQFVLLLRTGTGNTEDERALDEVMKMQTAEQREQEDDISGRRSQDDAEEADTDSSRQKQRSQQAMWRTRREIGGEIKGFSVAVVRQPQSDEGAEEEIGERQPRFADSSVSTEADGELGSVGAADGGSRVVLVVDVGHLVTHLTWHLKGDYFASTSRPSSASSHVLIHRLSAHASHSPFSKQKGAVSCCSFHPKQPFFLLAARSSVHVYHLVQQVLVKRLLSPMQLISSMAVHPSGDHVLLSSFDRKVCWFDLDMGVSPYRTLKYHQRAVRRVAFHATYPLFASASDDGCVHIFHATVYSDLLTNALIVPLKIIQAHSVADGLGVLDCCWHPTLPMLLTAGADQQVILWR